MYDILIIGGGPAGISAAIYAKSRGCNVLVLEQSQIGGQISMVSHVTHYCGLMKDESGTTFSNRLKQQLNDANIEIQFERVIQVKLQGEIKEVQTISHTYQAHNIILANGTVPRKLNIPGEKELVLMPFKMHKIINISMYMLLEAVMEQQKKLCIYQQSLQK